jgi:putative transposase
MACSLIEEKVAWYGRTFRKIGRFEPTSQVCSACGVKDGPKPLSVREWACTECGTVHDRDVNAAKNILAAGRAERLNACGTGTRPPLAVAVGAEARTHRSAARAAWEESPPFTAGRTSNTTNGVIEQAREH